MSFRRSLKAFSLLELLVVIAVIGIVASIVVSSTLGTTQQANQVIARQQQAQLQTALGNWISAEASQPGGLAAARAAYNTEPNKLDLLRNYLQSSTYERMSNSGAEVTSRALDSSRAFLVFTETWSTENHPSVTWSNQP